MIDAKCASNDRFDTIGCRRGISASPISREKKKNKSQAGTENESPILVSVDYLTCKDRSSFVRRLLGRKKEKEETQLACWMSSDHLVSSRPPLSLHSPNEIVNCSFCVLQQTLDQSSLRLNSFSCKQRRKSDLHVSHHLLPLKRQRDREKSQWRSTFLSHTRARERWSTLLRLQLRACEINERVWRCLLKLLIRCTRWFRMHLGK